VLRDHPSRPGPSTEVGRLRIDTAKVRAEERLDGEYLLSTAEPGSVPEDVALGYKNLLKPNEGSVT